MRAAEEDIEQGASTVPSLEAIDEDRESLHLSTVQEEGSSLHLSDLGSLHQPLFQGESHDADEDEDENDSNSDDALRGPPGILSDSSRDSYSETLADDSETSTSVSQLGTSDHSTLNGRRSSSTRGLTRTKARHDLNNDTQRSMTSTQGQMVQIRPSETRTAMDEKTRRRHRWKRKLSRFLGGSDGEEGDGDDDLGMKISMHGRLMVQPSRRVFKDPMAMNLSDKSAQSNNTSEAEDEEEKKREETQYRLTTMKKKRNRRKRPAMITGMYEEIGVEGAECCFCCPCPNMNSDRVMSAFLHWSFRSPFVVVFGTAAVGWLSMTFLFAVMIWFLGTAQPECIGGADFSNSSAPFMDAYQLSWTTFSTVGYGLVYPATSANEPHIHRCTLITVLTTFESFVGVLFSSLCAALMFAKVARTQSFAQVTFSDPIVIRYGTGVTTGNDDEDDDEDEDLKKDHKDPLGLRIPCPVLEFRIFNRLASLQGGEIIDATLNMVASIDASQADPALMSRNSRRKKGKKKRGATRNNFKRTMSLRHQRGEFSNIREEAEEEAISESSSGEAPTLTSFAANNVPKPKTPLRHRSTAERDTPLPLRGPAPSLTKRVSVVAPKTQEMRQEEKAQGHSHFHRHHHPDPRLAMRRGHYSHGPESGHESGSGRSSFLIPSLQRLAAKRRSRQDSNGSSTFFQQSLRQVSMRNKFNQQFEEDPSGKIIPKKMLSKLEVESPDHPFFRRIWLVRHTLDVNSLLLKPHVRQMLQRNQGFWPKELNNYESIRASLEFDQILVSLSGTSNADANSVYAQHVYHMVDVNIGYRFVNALYRDPNDGSLRVDQSLMNDVMEQAGGGGEPLHDFDKANFQDIMVL